MTQLKFMKKKLFIFGSSSRISESICSDSQISQFEQIFLIGRSAPSWCVGKKNIHFLEHKNGVNLSLDEFFMREVKDIAFAGLIYLPSAQFGRIALVDMETDQVNEVIQVTLTNAILVVRSFVRSQPRSASIILFSSQAATFGGNKISAYAAAKGGIESFVKGAARELGTKNIRINAISPGVIKTDSYDKYSLEGSTQNLTSSIPLGRLGTPSDISNAAAWLISEKSEYVNGAVLTISGGR